MAKATVATPQQSIPDLQDDLYDARQRAQLAFWIESARHTIAELRSLVEGCGELRGHAALREVLRHPAEWNDDMSGALQSMHIANSAVMRQASQALAKA